MNTCQHWRYLGIEQKRAYQRNMTIGWLIVVAIVAVGALLIRSPMMIDSGKGDGFGFGGSSDNESGAYGSARVSNPATPGAPLGGSGALGRVIASYRDRSAFRGGFIENLTIVREEPSIEIVPPTITADRGTDVFESDFGYPDLSVSSGASPYEMSSGIGYGDDDGEFGLPRGNRLSKVPYRLPEPPDRRNQNGRVMLGRIDWPGAPAQPTDTGYVVVDITIYPDGDISYRFIEEQPRGKGFRFVTEQALLYRNRYEPRVVDGRPVETVVRLFVTICLNCESRLDVLESDGLDVAALDGMSVYDQRDQNAEEKERAKRRRGAP